MRSLFTLVWVIAVFIAFTLIEPILRPIAKSSDFFALAIMYSFILLITLVPALVLERLPTRSNLR
jgi:hypothetical protein